MRTFRQLNFIVNFGPADRYAVGPAADEERDSVVFLDPIDLAPDPTLVRDRPQRDVTLGPDPPCQRIPDAGIMPA